MTIDKLPDNLPARYDALFRRLTGPGHGRLGRALRFRQRQISATESFRLPGGEQRRALQGLLHHQDHDRQRFKNAGDRTIQGFA